MHGERFLCLKMLNVSIKQLGLMRKGSRFVPCSNPSSLELPVDLLYRLGLNKSDASEFTRLTAWFFGRCLRSLEENTIALA
jgi:hypothetical protein